MTAANLLTLALTLTIIRADGSEKVNLNQVLKLPRNPPLVSREQARELARQLGEHYKEIKKGMHARDVVRILGLPQWEFDPSDRRVWLKPDEGLLHYRVNNQEHVVNGVRAFTIYFDARALVSRIEKNKGMVTTHSPRRRK